MPFNIVHYLAQYVLPACAPLNLSLAPGWSQVKHIYLSGHLRTTARWTQEGPEWPQEGPGERRNDHRMATRQPRMPPRCPQDVPKSARRREAASDPNRIRFRSQSDPTRDRQGPDHGPPRRARGENDIKNGSQNGSQMLPKVIPKLVDFWIPIGKPSWCS